MPFSSLAWISVQFTLGAAGAAGAAALMGQEIGLGAARATEMRQRNAKDFMFAVVVRGILRVTKGR
jgi:hypothetical protein